MKNLFFFISIILLLSSCKKEDPYNPDEHITYEHWYKLSGSSDTLYSVYFPNAFTPGNQDGTNDVFHPIGESFNLSHFRVFNRSGAVIFETADSAIGWDGRENNGPVVQMGVYSYQFMVSDIYSVNYEYYGTVMLYK